MAKMFPEWINAEQRQANPKFRAEFMVYDSLERSLSNEWYVFYSRTWTWVEQNSRLRLRETDFIIAHPKCGILLMEVKGGGIEVRDGQWFSTDRYRNEWEINPYEQVAIAVRSLERRLDEESPNPFRNYRFSTAVCFPNVVLSDDIVHLEAQHQRITIDAPKMSDLHNTIIGILKDENGNFDPPGEARILMLKELVAASWYLHAPASIQINETENEIKRLTDNQFKLLYQLAGAPRLLITGCAGSGKTMLAAEIARRMVHLHKKRVLFTCYNRNLAGWIRTSPFFVDNGAMMVANYHKLCADFVQAAGLELPKSKSRSIAKNHPIFEEVYPNLLLEAAEMTGQQFDAIIVDEGQDFLETWWTSLLLLLKEGGNLHVYYDPHQRLWGHPHDLPLEITNQAIKLNLTENVRNTKQIYELTMQFHPSRGEGYKALMPPKKEPQFVPVTPGEKEHVVVRGVIEQLIEDEKVSPSDIAILTPLSLTEGHSSWKPGKTLLGKYRLVHQLGTKQHEIFCSSIGAAKGLEFPVLILTELYSPYVEQEIPDYAAQLYVGVSRARSHLVIISDQPNFERIWQPVGSK